MSFSFSLPAAKRNWRWGAVLALSFAISACQGGYATDRAFTFPLAKNSPVVAAPGHGVVVLGFRVVNPANIDWQRGVSGAWIAIDPRSAMRSGDIMVDMSATGSRFDIPDAAKGIVEYRVYSLPAGTYALGWLRRAEGYFLPSQFQSIQTTSGGNLAPTRTFSAVAKARPESPVFAVRSGETVYVGDLTLDFSKPDFLRWAVTADEAAMRAYLKDRRYAGDVVARPLRRADGGAFGPQDGVARMAASVTTYR